MIEIKLQFRFSTWLPHLPSSPCHAALLLRKHITLPALFVAWSTLQSTEKMAPSKSSVPSGRKYWLDNLRSVMTTVMIINHTAAAYGGGGTHINRAGLKQSPILVSAVAYSYAFGLGNFFWLSGYMTAKSLSKASWREFVTSKLLRLGLPSLLYSIFLDPLQVVALRPRIQGTLRSNLKDYWKAILDFKGWLTPGAGIVWYTMTLLIFDLSALLLKRCIHLFNHGRTKSSEFATLAKFYGQLCNWGWLVVAGSRFLIGTQFPLGYELPVINVQPFYLPQHIYGYLLGYLAFTLGKPRMSSLFDRQSGPFGKLSVAKASAISLATLPLVLLPGWLRARRARKIGGRTKNTESPINATSNEHLTGWTSDETLFAPKKGESTSSLQLSGWTLDAAYFALWNEFAFATVGPAFMSLWENRHNQPGKRRVWSPRYAYAAYVLHSPISWFVGQGLHNLMCQGGERPAWMDSRTWQNLGPFVMTAAAGYIDVVAAFGTGLLLIDYVPGAGEIL